MTLRDDPPDLSRDDDQDIETTIGDDIIPVPPGTWYDTVVGPFINE